MAKDLGPRKFAPRIGAVTLALAAFLPMASRALCKREAMDLPVIISGTRPSVAAKINGREVRFIVDSGAFFSMITAPVAEEFKLPTRMVFGLRVGGIGGVTVPTLATVKEFTLKNVVTPNAEFLVGGSSAGSGVAGVLGQNLLSRWDVEYNLAQGMIRLMKDDDCRKAMLAYWVQPSDTYSVIDISKGTQTDPHTTGAAYVNGAKIRLVFDTGAAMSLLSRRAAERAGIKLDAPDVVDAGLVSGVGTGMVRSYIAPVDSFKFDNGEEIKHTRLRIADEDFDFTDMLLGADFFLSHRIFVANSQNKLYFTYNGGPVFNLTRNAAAAPASGEPPGGASAQQPLEGKSGANEPADAAGWERRGMAFAGRQDLDRALSDLMRACELAPTNADYLVERGHIYLQKRDPENAMRDFNRAVELKPDHVPALMSRAELHVGAHDISDARADLDAIDKAAAKQADVRFDMALAYEQVELMPQAITQLDLWIASHEEDSRLPIALASRCRARGVLGEDLSRALKDCNRAVSGSSKGSNPRILASRAFLHLRVGDFDKAIADYDVALKMNPQMPAALYGRGLAKIKKNRRSEGDKDIAEAVKMAPTVANGYKKMGLSP
jgi:tetratricopeptide (TPR) repeat protein